MVGLMEMMECECMIGGHGDDYIWRIGRAINNTNSNTYSCC